MKWWTKVSMRVLNAKFQAKFRLLVGFRFGHQVFLWGTGNKYNSILNFQKIWGEPLSRDTEFETFFQTELAKAQINWPFIQTEGPSTQASPPQRAYWVPELPGTSVPYESFLHCVFLNKKYCRGSTKDIFYKNTIMHIYICNPLNIFNYTPFNTSDTFFQCMS